MIKIKNYILNLVFLALLEVRLKYLRSLIGPFWITLNSIIIILGLSFVNVSIFNQPAAKIVPWIGFGILIWNYIVQIIDDSFIIFSNKIFLNINIQIVDCVIIYTFKNIIFFLHNIIIFISIIYYFDLSSIVHYNYIFLAFVFFSIYSVCILILFGLLCLRYMDFILIIKNLTFLSFLVTPIFWFPDTFVNNRAFFLEYNFLYHVVQLVRDPLMGVEPSILILKTNFVLATFLSILTIFIYKKYKRKMINWI